MIAHTGWTHTWTTMLKGGENGYHGASPHPNQHCKTQTGCRVPHREGLGPTSGPNRVPPSPIWVSRREELELTGSHRARFGSHRREELGPTGFHQVRIGIRARLVVLRARFLGPENAHTSGFNIACLHSIIRMQSAHMPCLGEGLILRGWAHPPLTKGGLSPPYSPP